jgi:hypothetical protein
VGVLVASYGAGLVMRRAAAARAFLLAAAVPVPAGVASRAATTATVMALAVLNSVLPRASYVAAETAGAATSHKATRPHRVQGVLPGIDQDATPACPAVGAVLLPFPMAGVLVACTPHASCAPSPPR